MAIALQLLRHGRIPRRLHHGICRAQPRPRRHDRTPHRLRMVQCRRPHRGDPCTRLARYSTVRPTLHAQRLGVDLVGVERRPQPTRSRPERHSQQRAARLPRLRSNARIRPQSPAPSPSSRPSVQAATASRRVSLPIIREPILVARRKQDGNRIAARETERAKPSARNRVKRRFERAKPGQTTFDCGFRKELRPHVTSAQFPHAESRQQTESLFPFRNTLPPTAKTQSHPEKHRHTFIPSHF